MGRNTSTRAFFVTKENLRQEVGGVRSQELLKKDNITVRFHSRTANRLAVA